MLALIGQVLTAVDAVTAVVVGVGHYPVADVQVLDLINKIYIRKGAKSNGSHESCCI